jgi:hypothetical protein
MQSAVAIPVLASVVAVFSAVAGQTVPSAGAPVGATDITFDEAAPVIDAVRQRAPAELNGVPTRASDWPAWVKRRDKEIRARLDRGDEDSVLNMLLFGTTFTRLPRALNDSSRLGGPQRAAEIVRGRIDDLAKGIISPGANERLQFARSVVQRSGIDPAADDARSRITQFLRDIMLRVVGEVQTYAETLQAARQLDPVDEFITRSKMLRSRGLSSDTSILPVDAIDEALEAIHTSVLGGSTVHRAAIIGPGLDFTDKAEGFDFYPVQTIQPYGLLDSLLRFKLAAAADEVYLTTFDLSPRVNGHIEVARQRAGTGASYTLELVHDVGATWQPRLTDYWRRFGDQIGTPADPVRPPRDAGAVDIRAVRIPSSVVSSITPRDLDIVLQHLKPTAAGPPFDLIVATNIFVYYGAFEQALALLNVATMLRPGGLLLSNNALPERLVPSMKAIGSTPVVYSDRRDDRDQIIWYQRQ